MCSAPCGARSSASTPSEAETAYTMPITASCWMLRSKRAREREEHRAAERERERVPVGRLALHRVAGENRHGETERRDLREREIDEHHAAREHVQPEPRVDRREHESRDERPEQELRHGTAASARARESRDVLVEERGCSRGPRARASRACAPVLLAIWRTSAGLECGSAMRMLTPRFAHALEKRRKLGRRGRHARLRLGGRDDLQAEALRRSTTSCRASTTIFAPRNGASAVFHVFDLSRRARRRKRSCSLRRTARPRGLQLRERIAYRRGDRRPAFCRIEPVVRVAVGVDVRAALDAQARRLASG